MPERVSGAAPESEVPDVGTLYGIEFSEWLDIRDERDRYAETLSRIIATDNRTKRETLRHWAATSLYPDMSYPLARLVCKRKVARRRQIG